MTDHGNFLKKRTVAGIATLAVAFTGLVNVAVHAADSELKYGDIDTAATGTLRIHKFESGSLTGDATPRKNDGTGDGVKGVPFKLFPINVDLTTPEGWDKISKVTAVPADACAVDGNANWAAFTAPGDISAKGSDQDVITVTTADGGIATKTDLALGAYLVCEQSTDQAVNKNNVKVDVIRKTAPFIVTLPRPERDGNGDHTGWIYDVNAYPKNTVVESPKKASELLNNGAGNANGIRYTITSKVPNLLGTQNFKTFSVIDQMPADLSDAVATSVTLDGTKLAENTDYKVDYRADQDFLAVNFTAAGLTKLKGKANTDVIVTIEAKVVFGATTNKVENTGYLFVDTVDGDVPSGDPTTPVTPGGPGNPPTVPNAQPGTPGIQASNKSASTWGDIKIRKHDAAKADKSATLKGAEFQIFLPKDVEACKTAAANNDFAQKVAEISTDNPDAINVGGETTFTTGDNGEVVVNGLFIDKVDAEAGVDPEPKTSTCYIVKETKAPAGYVLPAEAARTYAVVVNAGTSQTVDIDIPNTKVTVPNLPLTGASGRLLLMAGGLALVLGSMGVAMVIRRRKENA